MEGLKLIPYIFVILLVLGIIAAVSIMAMNGFKDSIETKSSNTTQEWNITDTAKDTVKGVTELTPSLALFGIAVAIITFVAGLYIYFKVLI